MMMTMAVFFLDFPVNASKSSDHFTCGWEDILDGVKTGTLVEIFNDLPAPVSKFPVDSVSRAVG